MANWPYRLICSGIFSVQYKTPHCDQRQKNGEEETVEGRLHHLVGSVEPLNKWVVGRQALFIFGYELRLGNFVGNCLWRIVKRKLVLKTPAEDAEGQSQKQERKLGEKCPSYATSSHRGSQIAGFKRADIRHRPR